VTQSLLPTRAVGATFTRRLNVRVTSPARPPGSASRHVGRPSSSACREVPRCTSMSCGGSFSSDTRMSNASLEVRRYT
jgi:hypothetical protein